MSTEIGRPIDSETEDVRTSPSELATAIAAQCWCDERTSATVMDLELAAVFAEKLDEYIDALQWCGGSADFGHGGQARIGWMKICDPLLRPKWMGGESDADANDGPTHIITSEDMRRRLAEAARNHAQRREGGDGDGGSVL